MLWVRAIVAKALIMQSTTEELDAMSDEIAGRWWQDIHDSEVGSLHLGKVTEVPLDDWDSFLVRSKFFVMHPVTFELPFSLLYPKERVLPPCEYCHGTGSYDPEEIYKGGC